MSEATATPSAIPSPLPKDVKTEEIFVEWTSPARPYKRRNREYYSTIASLVFLLGVILLLLKEFLLIGVILAFAFLSYVLASVPPETVHHKVTSKGIRSGDKLFTWDLLRNFWLESKWGQEVINVRTKIVFPSQLMMILEPQNRESILSAIGKKIPLEKPDPTWVDKSSQWLQDKLPLEQN